MNNRLPISSDTAYDAWRLARDDTMSRLYHSVNSGTRVVRIRTVGGRRSPQDRSYEVQKPESHAWCRVFTLLERAGVKEPAASRHQAHCGLRGHISGFGRKNQILNAVPQQTNGGRRATAVDVPTGLGTRSTPPLTPSPL